MKAPVGMPSGIIRLQAESLAQRGFRIVTVHTVALHVTNEMFHDAMILKRNGSASFARKHQALDSLRHLVGMHGEDIHEDVLRPCL